MPSVDTHCPYCALQCGMTLDLTEAGRVEVRARDFPTNRGGLCQKGWTAAELLDHPERLTTPLLHGEPATWDAALGYITKKIRELQAAHGRDGEDLAPCRRPPGGPDRPPGHPAPATGPGYRPRPRARPAAPGHRRGVRRP